MLGPGMMLLGAPAAVILALSALRATDRGLAMIALAVSLLECGAVGWLIVAG